MKNKICVYTCITGNYDNLKEIENKEKEIDYYCFTNNKKIKSKTWKIIYIEDEKLTNVQLARKIKILGHPIINENYEVLLWMDGAVIFRKKIMDFINTYLTNKDCFVAFKHGERSNITDECNACIRLNKETKDKVDKILEFYREEKYPDNNGLIESTVYIKRPKNKIVIDTMKLWFDMIINFTKRDQLSFNYCIYKTKLKVKWINEKVFDNDWFEWENHNFESKIQSYRLYFGNEEEYNSINDIQQNYKKKSKKYIISAKVPTTVDSMIVQFSKVPCTILNDIKLNDQIIENIEYYNYIDYKNKKVFYNKDAIVKIKGDFQKGMTVKLELDLEIMDKSSIFNFINEISVKVINQQAEIKILKEERRRLQFEKNAIVNSKGWKFLEKIRKMKPGK